MECTSGPYQLSAEALGELSHDPRGEHVRHREDLSLYEIVSLNVHTISPLQTSDCLHESEIQVAVRDR